ncbi:DivIVA domain-containing protein [Actinoplanes sp. NPDC051346]|uniref:DivIVA domain-containing protein n=1 Tax=Actinoplanes sp. NPDC051346 TaxID=3155048 RepID=UPI003416DC28
MTSDFTVALRGYDRDQVDRLLAQTDVALASSDEALRASARNLLQSPDLVVVLRGYARDQVDAAIRDRLGRLGLATPDNPPRGYASSPFVVVLRGYDMAQVDDALGRVEAATRSDDVFARAAARDALRVADFRVRIRGYDRAQVDRAVREAVNRLS